MNTFEQIIACVKKSAYYISSHGYDELSEDGIFFKDIIVSLENAIVIENYPKAWKGPSILLLPYDRDSKPLHVVWGIPKGRTDPAVLITAYRPDPALWDETFTRRNSA